MTFVLGICVFAGLAGALVVYVVYRRRRWVAPVFGLAVGGGLLIWCLTPVCVPIPDADLANFDPPIGTRTETGVIGQRNFQQRDGRWFHCKVRITRAFFF